MNQMILVCPRCDQEITNIDRLRGTPGGKIICDECAINSYVDIPIG
jgi:hypothetical protein